MKQVTGNHAPYNGAASSPTIGDRLTPRNDDRARDRIQATLSDFAALRQALALSERKTRAARNVIRRLKAVNTRLIAEIARLEQREERARAFAHLDELTGLPNRRLLHDRLQQAIARCAREDKQLALLYVDLDGFKSVNDTLGHATGDALLKRVADRIAASIRAADTACRYGGDEFVIMIPAIEHPSLSAAVAEKVRVRLAEPYLIGGFRIEIAASVGTALYPDHGLVCEELMKRADDALYRAKASRSRASITASRGESSRMESRVERHAAIQWSQ